MGANLRSFFAVVDGFLLFLALEGAFYAVALLALHHSFDTPTVPYLASNLIWTLLAALAAGYLVARIAHRSPVLHGVAMALVLLPLCLFNLNKGIGSRRTLFVVALNLLVPALCIVGAWMYRQSGRGRRQGPGSTASSQARQPSLP